MTNIPESIYLAHAVVGDAIGLDAQQIAALVKNNLARASRWLGWIVTHTEDVAIRCSWLGYVSILPESVEMRERGIRDCAAEAATCTGIVLCGGYLSSGMHREARALLDTPDAQNEMLNELVNQIDHESARYTGDGDPGCVGACLKCKVIDARAPFHQRYVLDLLDLGDEPPDWSPEKSRENLANRLETARTFGTNGPTSRFDWRVK